MNKAQKAELATALKDKFAKAKVAIFADYKGIEATQADELRKAVRDAQGEVKVIKNNVLRLIAKDGSLGDGTKEVADGLVGPTLIAFAYDDAAVVAKALQKFAKDNETFEIKDSVLGKTRIAASAVEELANLPSREVLLAKLLGSLNAPVSNFVGVLAAVPRSLVTVLSAIEKKKGETQQA